MLFAPATPSADCVLLVRLDNIGDFVVWLDAAEAIVRHYRAQGKRVTLLANAVWQGWAQELGLFNQVMALEEKRYRRDLRYRLRMGKEIRACGFGTAVQTAYTRILEGGDAVVRISGAPDRIGPTGVFDRGAERNRTIADQWYTALLATDEAPAAEIRRNAAFVRALTSTPYSAKVVNLRDHMQLPLPKDLAAELDGKRYFVLFPGATFAGRLWPAHRYVALAKRLHEATGFIALICGGPSEAAQAAWICKELSTPALNWVGRTSLSGLAAVLAHAELLVGNETSAVHIAAAVGTPSVCIVGGGHYGRFMPYDVEAQDGRPLPIAAAHRMGCFGCDWRCVYHPPKGTPVPCIEEVSVDEAWAAVGRALPRTRSGEDAEQAGIKVPGELTVLQCR